MKKLKKRDFDKGNDNVSIRSYKNIWVFHPYATPPTMNGFTRPYNFGKNAGEKYNFTIFSSSYLHFSDINLINNKKRYIVNKDTELPFVFVRTTSSNNNGYKRVLNMLDFYFNIFKVTKEYIKNHNKPDLIIASSPHPFAMIAGIKIAKKYGVPCICEVRDFWPEVFFMGGRLKENTLLGKMLLRVEKWIYKNAHAIIFLKEGDINYLHEKKWSTNQGGVIDIRKCHYINNGVNIEEFNKQINQNILNDQDLTSDKFNVIYTGAIRPVNNVGNLLDVAKILISHKNIQFLIYGEGNQLSELKRRVKDESITNVKIKGYIDKKYIPYVLSKSSVNILNYSQTNYNWSRGNSSNKLFEYMASGKPIISTVKMGYDPIEKYGCGVSIEKDTPNELADAIMHISNMSIYDYNEMSRNSKSGAQNYDYKLLTQKLISVMESLR